MNSTPPISSKAPVSEGVTRSAPRRHEVGDRPRVLPADDHLADERAAAGTALEDHIREAELLATRLAPGRRVQLAHRRRLLSASMSSATCASPIAARLFRAAGLRSLRIFRCARSASVTK